MDICVRKATPRDIPAIRALYAVAEEEQESFKSGWALQAGWGAFTVAVISAAVESGTLWGLPALTLLSEFEGHPVGYALATLERYPGSSDDSGPERLFVRHLVVEERARGIGIGELLLVAAAQWGRKRGARYCEMEVLPGNRAAKNFCEAHGLKARSITMSGEIEQVLDSVELDADEEAMLEALVATPSQETGCEEDPSPRTFPSRQMVATPSQETAWGEGGLAGAERAVIAAGCVVVKGQKVLLVRRRTAPYSGYWSIPGGKLERGESLEECARRELFEETGMRVELVGLAGIAERTWPDQVGVPRRYLIVNFAARPLGGDGSPEQPRTELAPGSGSEYCWADPWDLPSETVPGVAVFLRKAKAVIDAVSSGRSDQQAAYSPAKDAEDG